MRSCTLLMKPITCHMDYPINEQVEIHPRRRPGGTTPGTMSLPTTPLQGSLEKHGVRKFPLAPFYPPLFGPRQARDQCNVDSTSAAVRDAARGLLYGQEQMAAAQVDLRLVSAVARPPYYAPY